uniref:Peptidase aspartic putative domain-containing protein n=1 Tax=Glossina pallidipes TaxID=7398 RepID=A0A1A9ZG38_GLOPL
MPPEETLCESPFTWHTQTNANDRFIRTGSTNKRQIALKTFLYGLTSAEEDQPQQLYTIKIETGYALLATAKIIIKASNDVPDEFTAVLDTSSQVNIATERLIKRLSLTPTEDMLFPDSVEKVQKRSTKRENVNMKSTDHSFSSSLETFILPSVISAKPTAGKNNRAPIEGQQNRIRQKEDVSGRKTV